MGDLNILILEDTTGDVKLIESALKKGKLAFDSKWVKNKNEFEKALKTFHPDLILAGLDRMSSDATEAFKLADLKVPDAPFILVSGEGTSAKDLKSLKQGSTNYVMKDKISSLPLVIKKALSGAEVHRGGTAQPMDLGESHDLLENSLKVMGLIAWEWNVKNNKIRFSSGLQDMLGYNEDQKGIDFAVAKGAVHTDDLPVLMHNLQAHLDGLSLTYSCRYRVKHQKGFWVSVVDKGKVTKTNATGQPVVVSGMIQGSTGSEESGKTATIAGEEREKSWVFLDSVYKTVPMALTFLGTDFKIVSANGALCQLTGLSHADHYGKHFKSVLPEIAKKSEAFLKRVIKSGRPIFNFEIKSCTPVSAGRVKHFLISFYPIKGLDCQTVGVAINDITPLKMAEAAKFESEMRFHQMEENTNAIIWVISAGTNKLQYISPSSEKFWGLTAASLHEDPFSFVEKVHPDDQARMEQFIVTFLNSQKPGLEAIEFRIICPGEKVKWFNCKGFAIPDKNGNIKSYGGLIQDITDRKLTEEVLTESQDMLSETQKIVRLGSFKWNIGDNKVIWSDQLFRIFGYQPRQFPTSISTYLKFSFPEDQELIKKAINAAIIKKESFELEHRIVLPDGSIRIVALGVKVKIGDDGLPVQLIGMSRDITDRKQAEDVAQRFGRILDSALNELYIFGEETMHFIQASKSALHNLGYQLEELQALTPLDVKIGIDKEKMGEWISALKSGEKEGIVFEGTHQRKDGTTYPVEARLQYLRSETPPVFFAEVSDISERRKTQQARYEGQEMERKRIAMEIHDGIGQMLIAIKQRVLNLDFMEADKEELKEKVTEIDKILSMTIEEARRTSNNLAPIVLKKMGIEDAIEMLCNQTSKISNTQVLFDHKGPKISAGESILLAVYRILQEALNNIVKHSHATQAKVQFFKDKKNISLIIADNGNGFDMNGNIRKGSNGLNNMRERANLVNGDFYIETRENYGTYIKVDIPFDPKD